MLPNLSVLLPLFSLLISVCVGIGGYLAIRGNYTRTVGEVQDRVISALTAQNAVSKTQIASLEKEIVRMKRVVSTIQVALKRRGLEIEINGDSITLIDNQDRRAHTMQIRIEDSDELPTTGQDKEKDEKDKESE